MLNAHFNQFSDHIMTKILKYRNKTNIIKVFTLGILHTV